MVWLRDTTSKPGRLLLSDQLFIYTTCLFSPLIGLILMYVTLIHQSLGTKQFQKTRQVLLHYFSLCI